MSQLIIQERGRDEPLVHNCVEETISIGRLEENLIQLLGRGVSRNHAQIEIDNDNDNHYIIDLKSGNGTYLNGMRLAPEERNLLRPGDLITIDTFDIRFHLDDAVAAEGISEDITDSDVLEIKLLKKVLTALDKEMVPSLEVLNGSAEGKKLFLVDDMNEFSIGRDPDCEFAINEYVISRKHAKILKRWGGIAIRDLESKNGVFVNNHRVVEEYLHDGDRIALGTIVFLFRNPQEINLAYLEDIKPKSVPQAIAPQDIPGLEEEEAAAEFDHGQDEAAEHAFEEAAEEGEEQLEEGEHAEESEALKQWEELDQAQPTGYPTPAPPAKGIKSLTPIEIGMIGLGALVLLFAVITIVNLLSA